MQYNLILLPLFKVSNLHILKQTCFKIYGLSYHGEVIRDYKFITLLQDNHQFYNIERWCVIHETVYCESIYQMGSDFMRKLDLLYFKRVSQSAKVNKLTQVCTQRHAFGISI